MNKITLKHKWVTTEDKVSQLWLGNVLISGYFLDADFSKSFSPEGIIGVRWNVKKYWRVPDYEDAALNPNEAQEMCYKELEFYGEQIKSNEPEWDAHKNGYYYLHQSRIVIAQFNKTKDGQWQYCSVWDYANRYDFKPVASSDEAVDKCIEEWNKFNEALRTEKELSLSNKIVEMMNKFNVEQYEPN